MFQYKCCGDDIGAHVGLSLYYALYFPSSIVPSVKLPLASKSLEIRSSESGDALGGEHGQASVGISACLHLLVKYAASLEKFSDSNMVMDYPLIIALCCSVCFH